MSGGAGSVVFWGPFVAFGLILVGYGLWIWFSER